MGSRVLCVTSVIDTELWDKAKWMGTAVLSDMKSAPYLGLLFQNREAAVKIFEQWNMDFGHKDIYEEIRISIIEGDIPGEEHGYTVHIGTNQENLASKCKKLSMPVKETLFAVVSRFRRIETEINNHNMEMFRWEVEKYLSYKIIPVYMSQEGLEPLFEGYDKNPAPWVDSLSNANSVKTDFFEAKSTAYAKASVLIDDL